MALVPINDKPLAELDDPSFKTPSIPKKRKKVLEEEAYTKDLERIIQRDFFPDVPKLKAQNEYLDAEARNDVGKIRQLQMQYRPTPKRRPDSSASQITSASPLTFQSPATFETPSSPLTRGATRQDADPLSKDSGNRPPAPESVSSKSLTGDVEVSRKADLGLDAFLARVTSEDNASFEDIMEESDKRHRRKYPWLYEEDHSKKFNKEPPVLALTPAAGGLLLALEDGRLNSVATWEYKARNNVMQNPEGVAFTPEELEQRDQQKNILRHFNTRFEHDPWKNVAVTPGDKSAQMALGKIGPDGMEILPNATPRVNGYAFMPSPSPAPGVGESPMMTWGEIEGTPFALDASDTPSRTPGPQFKIPDVPDRDKLHLELVDNVTKRHRAKREEALKQVRSLASSSPKFGSASSAERLATMSPAAQRLATKRLGIRLGTDKVLAASYSPSPGRNPRTPISTPGGGTLTPSPGTPSTPSITDNLLDLRKAYSVGK